MCAFSHTTIIMGLFPNVLVGIQGHFEADRAPLVYGLHPWDVHCWMALNKVPVCRGFMTKPKAGSKLVGTERANTMASSSPARL